MNTVGRRLARIERQEANRQRPPRRVIRVVGRADDIPPMLAAQGIDPDDVAIVHRVIVEPDGSIGDQGPTTILSGV